MLASDTAKLLRGFYRLVHPDFFGRFPNERAVNEKNLVLLRKWLDLNQPRVIEGDGDVSRDSGYARRSTPLAIRFFLHSSGTDRQAAKSNSTNELVEIKTRLEGGLFHWQKSFLSLMRLAGLLEESDVAEPSHDDPNAFDAWRPIEWDGSLKQFLGETFGRASELRTQRSELDRRLSTRRCMLFDHFGIRLHMRPRISVVGDLDLQSFLCSDEIHRQITLIDSLFEVLQSRKTLDWRDVTICCDSDFAIDTDRLVDDDARLHFDEDSESWQSIFTQQSLALIRERQRELHSRREHEQALAAAFGFQAITAENGLRATDDYLDLLERLANAYHAGVRLGLADEPRLSLRVVSDELYPIELQEQVPNQFLVVPLSCDGELFRRRCSDAYVLWRNIIHERAEADREDRTMRFVQRATLLRHLWRHRSRVSREEMIGCCVRLRGLFHEIGPSLFRNNEFIISDHMSLREDGVLAVKWNWQ